MRAYVGLCGWAYVGPCGSMRAYAGLCGPMWAYVGLCGPMRAYVGLCGWAYAGLCGSMWAYAGLFGPMWTYVGLCGWAYAGLCGPMRAYAGLCGPMRAYVGGPMRADGEAGAWQAASRGDSRMVRALIQMGAHVDEVDERGRTALHRAVKRGHLGVVGVLLKLGANVNKQAQGEAHEAPLHLAARGRYSASLGLLLEVSALSPCASALLSTCFATQRRLCRTPGSGVQQQQLPSTFLDLP